MSQLAQPRPRTREIERGLHCLGLNGLLRIKRNRERVLPSKLFGLSVSYKKLGRDGWFSRRFFVRTVFVHILGTLLAADEGSVLALAGMQ